MPISGLMADDELVVLELMLNRFRRLLADLQRGTISRNDFHPWEVDILLDAAECQLDRRRRADILRQYQRAVEKQMETGPGPPMKLSEFLAIRARRSEKVG
ncbi:MAG: hypothetical protein JO336_05925 [Acidobacteriia bacterium]|nr:hypothetical protein [Terriglobia bacterium]MBV8906927.1 hypothetical protein [Terriglobia bacterium]MBV9742263.1 hypothetical protein [Terriglobia bacterium]